MNIFKEVRKDTDGWDGFKYEYGLLRQVFVAVSKQLQQHF